MSEVLVSPVANARPQEMGIIGSLITAYAELEFLVAHCAEIAAGTKDETTKRAIYRAAGNDPRLKIADVFLQPMCQKLRLGPAYAAAKSAVDHCLKIRNRYAHCSWGFDNRTPGIFFCNTETTANDDEGFDLRWRHIDLARLHDQIRYFNYARQLWLYLELEMDYRKRRRSLDRRRENYPRMTKPKEVGLPNPHSDPRKFVPPWLHKGAQERFLERIAKQEADAHRQGQGRKPKKRTTLSSAQRRAAALARTKQRKGS